jgi:hypothetical protein
MRLERLIGSASRKRHARHHASDACPPRNMTYCPRQICCRPSIHSFCYSRPKILKTLKGVALRACLSGSFVPWSHLFFQRSRASAWLAGRRRNVDRGASGAPRGGPEGDGVDLRGRGDRAVAGAGRPAAERACHAGVAGGPCDRLALARGRKLACLAGHVPGLEDGVWLVPQMAGEGIVRPLVVRPGPPAVSGRGPPGGAQPGRHRHAVGQVHPCARSARL